MNHLPSSVTEEPPVYMMHGIKPKRPWILEENKNDQDVVQEVYQRLQKNADKYIRRQQNKINQLFHSKKGGLVMVKALRVPSRE